MKLAIGSRRARGRTAAALVAMLVAGAPLAAQEATVYGTAGLDGDDTGIALLGVTARPGGLGFKPVASLQAYALQYPSGLDETESVLAVTPMVGVGYRTTGSSVEGKIGYSFQSRDVDAPVVEGEGGTGGVVTSLLAQTWASRPELQGIASYSWNSEYLWSQAQAALPVATIPQGMVSVGAEYVWQGQLGSEEGTEYRAQSIGPLVRFNNGRNLVVTTSGGYKDSNTRDATWYARVSFARYGITF